MKEKFLSGLKWFFRSFIWLGILLLGLDILTKQLVMNSHLIPDNKASHISLLNGFVYISYVRNPNAAFGFGFGGLTSRILYLVFATLISAGIITYLILKRKKTKLFIRAALVMVVTGAVGNMIDRIFYAQTDYCVVDWIDFHWFWPFVFNIADCCVVIAAFMLIIYVIVLEVKDVIERRKAEGVQVKQLSKTEKERLEQESKEQEENKK